MLFGYKILVLCTAKIYEDTCCNYLSGLNAKLVESDWRVFVFCVNSSEFNDEASLRENDILCDLINLKVADAVLISDSKIQDDAFKSKILEKASLHSIPAFVIDGISENTWNICFDAASGFEKVVRHVIEDHKIHDVHFMAGVPGTRQSDERLEVFKKVLADNNIPFNQDSMVSCGYFYDYPARVAVIKLIDEKRIPKAIICANDTMAVTVVSVLQEYGYKCPEDVVVTGFDGIDCIYFSDPAITSVSCDYTDFGKETADFVISVVQNKTPPATRIVQTKLVINNSCGCKVLEKRKSISTLMMLQNAYDRYRVENSNLNKLSANIRNCNSLSEVFQTLKDRLLYNTVCAVRKEFLNFEFFECDSTEENTFWNKMCLLLDSDSNAPENSTFDYEKNLFYAGDYFPRMKVVLDDYASPVIFRLLCNLDTPIGYLCFFFRNFDVRNYAKIDQIASWIGNSLSGYRNLQYQHNLQLKIEDMYRHDSLTGLFNRTGFLRLYEQIIKDPEVTEISFIMCDLDDLKVINDKYGHKEGDNAIRVVGLTMSSLYEGCFCRYGGDEIIGVVTQKIIEKEYRQKVRAKLEEYNRTSEKPYKIGASIGLVVSKKASFDKLFAKADKRMYEDKKQKKWRKR